MDKTEVINRLEELTQDDWAKHHNDSDVQEIAKAALTVIKDQARLLDSMGNYIENLEWRI